MPFLAPIVEGHGEVAALPALLHRIALDLEPECSLRVNPPIRVKAGSFLNNPDYFARQVTLAAAKAAQEAGAVIILLDCDDDCPATLGPSLLERARAIRSDVEIFVALAYREYEVWFLSAAISLRGLRGLPMYLQPPEDPESVRDAKGWLGQRMSSAYDPVTHQLEFSRAIDITQARQCKSFNRVYEFMRRQIRIT